MNFKYPPELTSDIVYFSCIVSVFLDSMINLLLLIIITDLHKIDSNNVYCQ